MLPHTAKAACATAAIAMTCCRSVNAVPAKIDRHSDPARVASGALIFVPISGEMPSLAVRGTGRDIEDESRVIRTEPRSRGEMEMLGPGLSPGRHRQASHPDSAMRRCDRIKHPWAS